jgi:polar amino acid transport system substrate-binding protein
MIFSRNIFVFLVLILAFGFNGVGAPEQCLAKGKLLVGTKEAPPFVMKNADGTWSGISIDLWRQIASELNLAYEFRELDQYHLIEGIANKSLDVVVAELTITPERLERFDFTYPFYTTGLGVAVTLKKKNVWLEVAKKIFSKLFLQIIVTIAVLLFLVGILIWWFERRKNLGHFGGNAVEGIGSGFWFSAVTMTTVGYGDKHPKTIGGRIVSLIWMFSATIILTFFTATITSMLTVEQLETSVHGLEDLRKTQLGTLPYTTSEDFLKKRRMSFQTYQSVNEGLAAVARGDIKAFVYDAPELRYRIKEQFSGQLEVLPTTYSHEDYGFALAQDSPLRHSIDLVLLQKTRSQEWQEILYRYLGR